MKDENLLLKGALQLAFEAGKWVGQVELEEHFDIEQYMTAGLESTYTRKIPIPMTSQSNGRTVTIDLRSDTWREGVRKRASEYLAKAFDLIVANYKEIKNGK
jgi:hypothetical protein